MSTTSFISKVYMAFVLNYVAIHDSGHKVGGDGVVYSIHHQKYFCRIFCVFWDSVLLTIPVRAPSNIGQNVPVAVRAASEFIKTQCNVACNMHKLLSYGRCVAPKERIL